MMLIQRAGEAWLKLNSFLGGKKNHIKILQISEQVQTVKLNNMLRGY